MQLQCGAFAFFLNSRINNRIKKIIFLYEKLFSHSYILLEWILFILIISAVHYPINRKNQIVMINKISCFSFGKKKQSFFIDK